MLYIADDADDLGRHGRRPQRNDDAPAERVFIREILLRQRLVDDDDVALLADLLLGEEPAALERDFERAEEVQIGDTNVRRTHWLIGQRLRAAFDFKSGSRAQPEERGIVDRACRFDAGQGLHPFEGLREKVDPLRVIIVAGTRQRDPHRQHVPRVEARVDPLQAAGSCERASLRRPVALARARFRRRPGRCATAGCACCRQDSGPLL